MFGWVLDNVLGPAWNWAINDLPDLATGNSKIIAIVICGLFLVAVTKMATSAIIGFAIDFFQRFSLPLGIAAAAGVIIVIAKILG